MAKKDDKKKKKNKLVESTRVTAHTPKAYAEDEVKRLNRLVGQIEGIKKMLLEERSVESILTQCKAAHSALRAVESRLLEHYLDVALSELGKDDKKKSRDKKIGELVELYKPVM